LKGLRAIRSIMKINRLVVLWAFWIAGCAVESPVPTAIPGFTPEPTATVTLTPFPAATNTVQPSPSPTQVCTDVAGQIEEITYSGYIVEGEVPVRVYLPPCYGITKDRYPTLYVLHGYPMDELHWISLGVIEAAENGFAVENWEPFLIVMPRIPDPLNTRSDGGPGSYEEEFLLGLLPSIEQAYRTLGSAKDRAIAGVSRGGVWALEIGLRNANVFNTVAALSPALHVNNPRPAYNPFNLIRNTEQLPENIFLSAAKDEGGFRTKTEELSQLMDDFGIAHTYLLTAGLHEDATWEGIMEDLLRFIAVSLAKTLQ
jgi:enterochelin esterase-like enzyme